MAADPIEALRPPFPCEQLDQGEFMATPLLTRGDFEEPSMFRPDAMLREASRRRGLPCCVCPDVCLLDPDGDIVRYAQIVFGARRVAGWACFHTELWEWEEDGVRYGAVAFAVGASFAVMIAEQLFACGCRLLFSVASAGQVTAAGAPPYHVLIEQALRDEGTSHHYLPPARFSRATPGLLAIAQTAIDRAALPCRLGASWTTDAPFRETRTTVAARAREGALIVEMEAAALYAFAQSQDRAVLCVAHVTNSLACVAGDFEKGDDEGASASLAIVRAIAEEWRGRS